MSVTHECNGECEHDRYLGTLKRLHYLRIRPIDQPLLDDLSDIDF